MAFSFHLMTCRMLALVLSLLPMAYPRTVDFS